MPIVTGITKRIESPHEPGQHAIIRQLSWRQREQAAEVQMNKTLTRVKNIGPELLREFQRAGQPVDVDADPAVTYDRGTVLQAGLVAWSYSEEPTPEEIDGLDEATVAWLFGEIIAFSGPLPEEERKNDSSPSI